MKTHSLTNRVVFFVVLVELLCVSTFSGVSLWHEWRIRADAIDAVLQGRSDSVLGAIQDAEDPTNNVLIDPVELKLPSTDRFAVFNQRGALLGGQEQTAFPLTRRAGVGLRSERFQGRSYRVLERTGLRIIDRAETGGVGMKRPVTIVYAIPVSSARIWHEILEAAGFYIGASLVLTAATVLLFLWLMRGLLRPVEELAAAAAHVSPAMLSFQPPASAQRVRELTPLLQALSSTINGLREAFQKQQRFVGDAAHELKTAVAVVRSTVQLLELRPRTVQEYRTGLDAVLRDQERVEELVSRMLLSAARTPALGSAPETGDLSLSTRSALHSIQSLVTARHIALEVSLAEEMIVNASEDALRTLVTNLVVNAVQHSREHSSVTVQATLDSSDEESAVLLVSDGGEGIEAKDLPFVFDRFFRADASRSRETGGAGLGLAICKTIVDAAGGSINLQSTMGVGTTVRVSLPLAPRPAPAVALA